MIANTGLGDVGTTTSQVGGSVGGGLLTAGAIAGGPTNPIGIGLMIAGAATLLGSSLLHVFGVGVRNPYEDKDVKTLNEIETQLQANLAGWNSGSKTSAEQQDRLAAFDFYFSQVATLCNDPGLSADWARGCIGDRVRGGKWDWYAMYRDPISSGQTSDGGSIVGSVTSLVGGGNVMYIAGGMIVLGIILASKE